MTDYRLPQNRLEYFSKLYAMNLQHGVMPGLVYLYMPELAQRNGWDDEQKLWFAFLNGLTQNPITSLRLFTRLPQVPPVGAELKGFTDWFNAEWDTLQFDTDRRYQKKDTVAAIKTYAHLVDEYGSQAEMLAAGKSYSELWSLVRDQYRSFGRLSSFSYLEYVYLNGFGADCNDLLFEDKSGSKSHRNGMLFLLGQDGMVWDKRQPNSHDGVYPDFKKMCVWLGLQAEGFLHKFAQDYEGGGAVSKFTFESNLCTFKNHFFGRRYPGVYADMAWERIVWADERGQSEYTGVFKDMRGELLPEWLRIEHNNDNLTLKQRAAIFPETGSPYRGGHFL
jgi:hypothetical protein